MYSPKHAKTWMQNVTGLFCHGYRHLANHTDACYVVIALQMSYLSESDILDSIDFVSDIDNLVSFEMAIFADYSKKFTNKM